MTPATLFDLAEQDADTIQSRFLAFHESNPDVFALFVILAEKMRAAGWRRYSAKTIIEQIRWHYDLASGGKDGEWRLNNNFTSRYVRLLIETRPEFAGFFETRTLTKE